MIEGALYTKRDEEGVVSGQRFTLEEITGDGEGRLIQISPASAVVYWPCGHIYIYEINYW